MCFNVSFVEISYGGARRDVPVQSKSPRNLCRIIVPENPYEARPRRSPSLSKVSKTQLIHSNTCGDSSESSQPPPNKLFILGGKQRPTFFVSPVHQKRQQPTPDIVF